MVTGLGPVGLGVALLAQRLGAQVVGLERDPARAAFARQLGIEALDYATGDNAKENNVKAVKEWAGGDGVEVAIDCSGNSLARLTCLESARPWGRIVFVGEEGTIEFDVSEVVIHKSLTIYGSWVCSITQMEELVDRLVRWNLHPEVKFNTYLLMRLRD